MSSYLEKPQRLVLIFAKLRNFPPFASREQALEEIAAVFDEIESAHCEDEKDRMLPPSEDQGDRYRPLWFSEEKGVRLYKAKKHSTLIAKNGGYTFCVVINPHERPGKPIFSQPGHDGKLITDIISF